MKKVAIALAVITLSLTMGCKSQKSATSNEPARLDTGKNNEKRPQGGDPFKTMDINNDGKLTKLEVTGPLLEDFDKLDVNGDYYLTKEELGIKDKPEGGRPEGGPGGGGLGGGQGGPPNR